MQLSIELKKDLKVNNYLAYSFWVIVALFFNITEHIYNNNLADLLCKFQEIRGCFALHRLLQPVASVTANCGALVAVATAFDETSKISREQEWGVTTSSEALI